MIGRTGICSLLLLLYPACFGLNEKEEIALNGYKQNSKAYYNNGDYMAAIDQCYKGLELDDGDYSLNLTLGWALLRAGGKENIFKAYEQFSKTDSLQWFSEDYRVSMGLGQTCYKIATLFRQKLDYYERKIEEDPGSAEIFEEEIETCREGFDDNLELAIDYLERALDNERQQDNIEGILTLGQAFVYADRLDDAVEKLTLGLDLLERSTSFQQARLDAETNLTSDGRRFFERQIRRNLRLEKDLRGILATVYRRREEYEKALEQYDILEARDLFEPYQHYNRGLTLQTLGRFEEAIQEFELFMRRASLEGRDFEDDERFHRAFERIEECKQRIGST